MCTVKELIDALSQIKNNDEVPVMIKLTGTNSTDELFKINTLRVVENQITHFEGEAQTTSNITITLESDN